MNKTVINKTMNCEILPPVLDNCIKPAPKTNGSDSKQQAALFNNQLKQEHDDLYKHFAKTYTDLAVANITLSVYEQALKQILSAADVDKVISIAKKKQENNVNTLLL